MRFRTAVFMAGLGFTIGLLFGLFLHLPVATLTFPTSPLDVEHGGNIRVKRHAGVGDWSQIENPGHRNFKSDLIKPGAAVNLQSGQEDYNVGNTGAHSPLDNAAQVPIGRKSLHLNALNQFPNKDSESLVYVNPVVNKLVYDNNRTDPKNQSKKYGGSEVPETKLPAGARSAAAAVGAGDGVSSDASSTDGVYWSKHLESLCPSGFSRQDHDSWRTRATSESFVKMEEGCGRMQNRLLTFHDDQKACARYRLNVDQIQGEIFTYYLSKLLNINNIPPSTLQLVDTKDDQWRLIHSQVANAQWSEEKPVILAQWIEGLTPAYIPYEFRNQTRVFRATSDSLKDKSTGQLCELMQWSDLIVLDYLTANLDRVVNNLFNLQWNDQMMTKPAHNLEQGSDGRLVFLDNESGLFHGYRLLDKYSHYHQKLLDSVCVFRQSTVDALRHFLATDSIGEDLQRSFEANEPLHRYVPRLPLKNIKVLKQRMNNVYTQVQKCESLYGR